MGKSLRPEHLAFFNSRMGEHHLVVSCEVIPSEDEYLFKVTRTLSNSTNDVFVHLTDAYRYGLAEFYSRPSQIRSGSFVVIGMPHASASREIIEEAKKAQIGIGHVGKFMGALNSRKLWEYVSPEERRQQEYEKRGLRG